ncbi:putative Ig domain-containing protein, partial [Leeia sp. TBRC 13508]
TQPIVPTSPVVEPQTTPPATTETPPASNDTTTSPTQETTTDAPFSNIIAASVDTNFENTAPVSTLPDLSVVQSFNQRSSIEDNLTQVGVGAFRIPVIKADEVNLMVYNGVQDQIYEKNADVDFKLPADAFVHTQEDAVVKLTAQLSDGKALPTWLHFDATSGRFQGTPPADVDSIIEIVVTARDNDGRTASTVFKIRVGKIATNKLSFNEQVLQAKQGSPISRLQSASPIKIRA